MQKNIFHGKEKERSEMNPMYGYHKYKQLKNRYKLQYKQQKQ